MRSVHSRVFGVRPHLWVAISIFNIPQIGKLVKASTTRHAIFNEVSETFSHISLVLYPYDSRAVATVGTRWSILPETCKKIITSTSFYKLLLLMKYVVRSSSSSGLSPPSDVFASLRRS